MAIARIPCVLQAAVKRRMLAVKPVAAHVQTCGCCKPVTECRQEPGADSVSSCTHPEMEQGTTAVPGPGLLDALPLDILMEFAVSVTTTLHCYGLHLPEAPAALWCRLDGLICYVDLFDMYVCLKDVLCSRAT
jgi:hypothetical protein